MNPIEKVVTDIKEMVHGGDLSDGMPLRSLHKKCVQAFEEMNQNLAKCRALIQNGDLQEARSLNCSLPLSLTRMAELLCCEDVREFLNVCSEYGLEKVEFPDESLLNTLSLPNASGEKHLHILLQDYRKIARAGSKKERIELLRKIVGKLPDSPRWRNDLHSAERGRLQEMEAEFKALPEDENLLQVLENMYRELLTPEWSVFPKGEFVERVRNRLLPLQQEKFRKQADEKLQLLQDLCIERNIELLRREFDEWQLFCSNPLVKLNAEQLQTVADVENFLVKNEEEENNKKLHDELIKTLEDKLADNCTFAEIAGDYNQLLLQLEEYPVSPNLLARLRNLEEESLRKERFRNVRRCVYGTVIAVVTVALVAVIAIQTQKYLAVKNNCRNLELLIKNKKYVEAANLYVTLRASSPAVADDSRVIALYNAAVRLHEEEKNTQKRREEEFLRLIRQIGKLASGDDVLDNAKMIDKSLAEARKLMAGQMQKNLDSFRELETKITENRTQLKQKRQNAFLESCARVIQKAEKRLDNITKENLKTLALDIERIGRELQRQMELLPYVPEHLKKREKIAWESFCDRYKDAVEREKRRRLVVMPDIFETYLKALADIQYKDSALAQKYSKAVASMSRWKRNYEMYQRLLPDNSDTIVDVSNYPEGILKKDLEKIFPGTERSKNFSNFFNQMQKLKSFYELRFTSAENMDYFFYVKDMPVNERLRKPTRINISFNTMVKNNFYVFKFDPGAKVLPYSLMDAPVEPGVNLPRQFAELNGNKKFSRADLNNKCSAGIFADKYSVLGSNGPGVFWNLQRALLELKEPGIIQNVYLKEEIFCAFLEEFCLMGAPYYNEVENIRQKFKNYLASRKRSWQTPHIHREYKKEKRILEDMWAETDLKSAFSAGKLRKDFICAFHARKLVPASIVQKIEKDKIFLHSFISDPKEYFVWEENGIFDVTASISARKVLKNNRKYLYPGQVLWTFGDGRKTADFINEWKKKAVQLNILLDTKVLICPEGMKL